MPAQVADEENVIDLGRAFVRLFEDEAEPPAVVEPPGVIETTLAGEGPIPAAEPTAAEPVAPPAEPGFDVHVTPAVIMAAIKTIFDEIEALEGEIKGWPTEADLSEFETWRTRALKYLKLLVRHQGQKATAEDWQALERLRARLPEWRIKLASIRTAMVGGEGEGARRGIPTLLWIPIAFGAFLAAKAGIGMIISGWSD